MNLSDPPASALPALPSEAVAQAAGSQAQTLQFVTFSVADEMFAVPMGPVQEIIRVPDVARMPLAPPALQGLANLRGKVLPIVSLRHLFGLPACEADDASRALVIQLGIPIGFVVDRVASVISVEAGQMAPASSIESVISQEFLTGVIQRPQASGEVQLLQVLDFGLLARQQFARLADVGNGDAATGGAQQTLEGTPASSETDNTDTDEARLVSFTVAGQEYAIDIASVQEIVQVPDNIIGVPRSASHVLGLMSLRQRLLPLVSLRTIFALPMDQLDEHHRVVVVGLPGGHRVGLVTDTVKEVLRVPRDQTDAMPGLLAQDQGLQEFEAICRLDDGRRLVSIITTSKLLGLRGIQEALHAQGGSTAAAGSASIDSQAEGDHTVDTIDDDSQMVIFRLGAEEFGVPIMSVQEIVRLPDTLTHVPRSPPWVEGMINLRGAVLPVVDQRARFGLPPIERNERQRIMVYLLRGVRTGFIVDAVTDVLRVAHRLIEPAPSLSSDQSGLISQVAKLDGDGRLVLLVDPTRLLDDGEAGAIGALTATSADASFSIA